MASRDQSDAVKGLLLELADTLRSKAQTLSKRSDDTPDLLKRARRLAKLTRGGKKPGSDSSVMITVFRAKQDKNGRVLKGYDSNLEEIEANRDDSYEDIISRAVTALHLPKVGQTFALYRPNTAHIPNADLTVNLQKRKWTLGNYLLVLKKSPSQIKFGVGFSDSGDNQPIPDPSTRKRKPDHHLLDREGVEEELKVWYGKEVGGLGISIETEMDRSDVLKELRRRGRQMDDSVPYQPEEDGWKVTRLKIGDATLLQPVTEEGIIRTFQFPYYGRTAASSFCLVAQSQDEVVVNSITDPVSLYCVASTHDNCIYEWCKMGSPDVVFPNTPVVYVKGSGLYRCIVSTLEGDMQLESDVISVEVQPRSAISDISYQSKEVSNATNTSDPSLPVAWKSPENIGKAAHISVSTSSGNTSKRSRVTGSGDIRLSCTTLKLEEEDLKKATDSFDESRLIGVGGFGKVYKGFFRSTYIAIKLITTEGSRALGSMAPSCSSEQGSLLAAEVNALSKLRHRNVVELMGFCEKPPALVFEFMENGSLSDHLHSKDVPALTWQKRGRILKDACRGLAWLHGCKPQMIHQDVKSANILLDKSFGAKLGDFGFTVELPRVVGDRTLLKAPCFARTEGYYPPELSEGLFSPKSDMYSYGVVVLETYSGMKAYSCNREDRRLTDHLEDNLRSFGSFQTIRDRRGGPCAVYLEQIFFDILSHCLVRHSRRRSSEEIMKMWSETIF